MLDPDAAPRPLRYAESIDAAQLRLKDTSPEDVGSWMWSRSPHWAALALLTLWSGVSLALTVEAGAVGWAFLMGTMPFAAGPLVAGGVGALEALLETPIWPKLVPRLSTQAKGWAVLTAAVLTVYTVAEGAHAGKVFTGVVGGGLAWWVAFESLRYFARALTSTRITVQGHELYVERLLLGEPYSERALPLSEIRPVVVETELGSALQLGERAFVLAGGTPLYAIWWASRRLEELSRKARNRDGAARPPDEIAALVPEMDALSPRRVSLPGLWARSSALGVAVGIAVAAAAYPFCAQFYWSIHAIGGIAITGVALGLWPAVQHFTDPTSKSPPAKSAGGDA